MQTYNSIVMAAFLILGVAIILFSIAPVSLQPILKISPDFLFCFIFIFLIRRPQNVPLISIIFISLLADFLWFRPIGLNTLTTVLASEFIRWLVNTRENINLFEEMIYITIILLTTTLCQEAVKIFTSIPSLSIGQLSHYMILTLVLYLMISIIIRIIMRSKLVKQ